LKKKKKVKKRKKNKMGNLMKEMSFIAKVCLLSKLLLIVCDLPPEYCMVDKKDNTECKKWLSSNYPELFAKIYPEE